MGKEKRRTKKSEAERIKTLLRKRKSLLKKKYETVSFNSPVLFLMRRNGTTDFYENATAGEFEYEHTNGEKMSVILHPNQQTTFNYGKTSFKGYIHDEDSKIPYPHKPILYAELWDMHTNKILHDIRKHKAGEERAIGIKWQKILIGIAIVIAVIAVAQTMGFNIMGFIGEKEVVIQQVQQNITPVAEAITGQLNG